MEKKSQVSSVGELKPLYLDVQATTPVVCIIYLYSHAYYLTSISKS